MPGTVIQSSVEAREQSDAEWRDLVDRLAVYDIHYLTGGSEWDGLEAPYRTAEDAPLADLTLDLAGAPAARLRDAIVALLLRHPEAAATIEDTARKLSRDDRRRLLLLVSIVVASALQHEWGFSLSLYLSGAAAIDAEATAEELELPEPSRDFGRPALAAAAELLRVGAPFPFNYEAAWEKVARRLLAQLRAQASLLPL